MARSLTPKLINNDKIAPCKSDNFVPIVVPCLSTEAHLTSSPQDSAESTKELTPDEQETTQASRNRLQDLPEWLEEFTEILVEPRSTSSGSDSRDPPPARHSPSQSTRRKAQFVKDPKIVKYASVRRSQEHLADEILNVTYSAR